MTNIIELVQLVSHDMQMAQEWATKTNSWVTKSASNSSSGDCKISSKMKFSYFFMEDHKDDTGHNEDGSCLSSLPFFIQLNSM